MNDLKGNPVSLVGNFVEERDWTPEESYRYCEKIIPTRFPHAPFNPRFLSGDIRPHFESISVFCLFADEFSNSPEYLDNLRPFFIENWEAQLLQCVWRKPKNPVFNALRETINRFDLPVRTLQDLLAGHKFDLAGRRYSDIQDLMDNYLHSSRALGKLALQILGHTETDFLKLSDSFCSGVRMAHLWKNLLPDVERGRIYIPEENLRQTDYNDEDLRKGRFNSGFRTIMADLVEATRDLLWKSRPLLGRIDPRVRFEAKRIWNGGLRILDRIEEGDFNVFKQDPDFTLKEHLLIFFRTVLPARGPGGDSRRERK